MPTCSAFGCCYTSGKSTREAGIVLHRFPRDVSRARQWWERCRDKEPFPSLTYYAKKFLCSQHFTQEDYNVDRMSVFEGKPSRKRGFMKDGAVPTIFRGVPGFRSPKGKRLTLTGLDLQSSATPTAERKQILNVTETESQPAIKVESGTVHKEPPVWTKVERDPACTVPSVCVLVRQVTDRRSGVHQGTLTEALGVHQGTLTEPLVKLHQGTQLSWKGPPSRTKACQTKNVGTADAKAQCNLLRAPKIELLKKVAPQPAPLKIEINDNYFDEDHNECNQDWDPSKLSSGNLELGGNRSCVSLGTATFILAPDPRSQGGTDWTKETLIMPNGQDIREVDDRRNPLPTCEDNLNTTAFHSDSLEATATILTETDIKQEPELENSVSVPEHIGLSSESGDGEFDEEKESDGCESEPKTKRQKKVPKEDSDWAPSEDSSEESGGESISEDSENSDESDYEHKRKKSQQHNPFQCLKCDREYEIHMELCTHIVKEHTTEESRQVDVCVLCTKPWTPALLGKHMREVHGVEDFVDWSADNNLQCTRCSNIHQDVLSFLFHLEDAHRTTAVKCSKCEFTSIYTYQLFRHMAKKHGCMDQENVVVTNKRPVYRKGTVIGTAIDPVTCALCGATPGINLNKHIQAEHPEALALHKYSCYICPSVSPSYNVLRGHFRARHNGRQCCFCPFSCRHRSLMEDHVWMKHLNITKYTCKLCHTPLHFTRKCRYLVHTKRVHEGKKDYLCHECGKSFKTSSSFQIHYRQHTGEKPIMCTECGFRCRQPNSLNWHKKKHHPK